MINMKFVSAYTKMGLTPDGSSTYFLPRIIGVRRYMELISNDFQRYFIKIDNDWYNLFDIYENINNGNYKDHKNNDFSVEFKIIKTNN